MKELLKRNWWIILVVIIILGFPIFLNFFVFKPNSQLCVGELQDWMAFLGNYIGATISAAAAFIILFVQRKEHKKETDENRLINQIENAKNRYEACRTNNEIRNENRSENLKNRQLQLSILSYQQEMQWFGDLRGALVNYISAYSENDVKIIVNSMYSSSFEAVQLRIKALFDNLIQADTVLSLVISGNPQTTIGSTYKKDMNECYNRYKSTIEDLQLLVCLYYKKNSIANIADETILQHASNYLKSTIKAMDMSQPIDYNQLVDLAHQLIKPLPDIFETIRTLANNCMNSERIRIDSLLDEPYEVRKPSNP